MAGLPPGRGNGAPVQALPPWLSRISSPTATVDLEYTYATLRPDGVPTLVVTAERVTQYGTDILQLPLTVNPAADVSGEILGTLYTTAGGDAAQTVVRELGGTKLFTLGGSSGTRALAGATMVDESSARATPTAMPAAVPSSATASTPVPTSSPSPSPSSSGLRPTSPTLDPTSTPLSSLASVATSLSAALASATAASTVDSTSVASLSRAYSSAASVLSAASSRASSTSNPSLSSAPKSSTTSSSTQTTLPSSSASSVPDSARSLTPSQLAAAIAAPLCFFLLLLFLLFLCCFCVRRRRRRHATERAIAEEEGLLGSPSSQPGPGSGSGLKKRERTAGVLWEWVPARAPSRLSGRSGRSVLSRLTGGLFGGGRGAKSATGSSPKSSPQENAEKGFVGGHTGAGEGRSPRTDEEKGLLEAGEGGGGGDAAGGAGLAAAASRGYPYGQVNDGRYGPVEPFDDVDLTSPRVDVGDGTFATPEYPSGTQGSPPTLLPIQPASPIRLSRFYDPSGADANAYFPPSPSSYSTPSRFVPSDVPYSSVSYAPPLPLTYAAGGAPLGPVRQATSTLSQLWQGYETNSPRTDADAGASAFGGGEGAVEGEERTKRDSSRLGYLSWSTADGQQHEYTPPQTPDPLPVLRVIPEREDDERSYDGSSGSSERRRQDQPRQTVVSEGGWLSGRLGGFFPRNKPSRDTLYEADEEDDGAEGGNRLRVPGVARRGSDDTNDSGQSDELRGLAGGDLFLNSPRWIGARRRRSSPPPFSSFEPLGSTSVSYDPPIVLRRQTSASSLDPPYHQPRHWSSFATETDSRYHDADSPIFAPTPAESPALYPSPRVTTVVKGRHQREESGVSVLGRIAASFGALKGGVASGLPRRREFSTESSMDPFQYAYAASPAVPSPTSSPRKQRLRGSLTTLRHSQSQPVMQRASSNAPPLPLPSARPLSTVFGRYLDPFADADVDADGDADDERPQRQVRAYQERREHEYGQERDGPDMVEIRRVGEQAA